MNPVSVCICIPTYKRPERLRACLSSLAGLKFHNTAMPELKIIIVENESGRSSYPIIETIKPKIPWPVEYDVEKRRGISFVRNKLVSLAKNCDFIAFIDDDETAEPQWLDELLQVQNSSGADAVIGPVVPEFGTRPPDWMAPLFYRPRHPNETKVSTYHFLTGNVLLVSKTLAKLPEPFDPAFALTGGEDGYLGRRLTAKGANFYWADRAVVHEYIPESRINISWLLKRYFRSGMTSAMIDLRQEKILKGWTIRLFKGFACIPYGVLVAIFSLKPGRKAVLRGACLVSWGVGSLAGLFGVRYKEYNKIHGK